MHCFGAILAVDVHFPELSNLGSSLGSTDHVSFSSFLQFKELSDETDDVVFIKVDVDDNPDSE